MNNFGEWRQSIDRSKALGIRRFYFGKNTVTRGVRTPLQATARSPIRFSAL